MNKLVDSGSIKGHLSRWWSGQIVPHENPNSSMIVIIGYDTKRHWSSHLAHALMGFWLRHWQWCIGTALAIAGLIAAFLALGR